MSGELFNVWKKFGKAVSAPAQQPEQKKVPKPEYIPPAPQGSAAVPAGLPVNSIYVESVNKSKEQPKSGSHTEEMKAVMKTVQQIPAAQPVEKKASAKNEMEEIMKKKSSLPQQVAPESKRKTYTEEMADIMRNKTSGQLPSQQAVPKKANYTEEMKNIMQAKGTNSPFKPASEPVKRTTYNDEMKKIFEGKANLQNQQQLKQEAKRKSATEEMNEIMKAKEKMQVQAQANPIEKRKEYNEEVKPAQANVQEGAQKAEMPAVQQEKPKAQKIEEDEELKKIKDSIEEKVKFGPGDNLEMKKVVPPVIQAEIQPIPLQNPEQQNVNIVVENSVVLQPEQNPNPAVIPVPNEPIPPQYNAEANVIPADSIQLAQPVQPQNEQNQGPVENVPLQPEQLPNAPQLAEENKPILPDVIPPQNQVDMPQNPPQMPEVAPVQNSAQYFMVQNQADLPANPPPAIPEENIPKPNSDGQ
jgi:hypothetical protein